MKKIVITLATVGIVGLSGCASNAPAPTVTVTATPEVTTPAPDPAPVLTDEEVFIMALENEFGPLTPKQEKRLIDFAYDVCVSFETVVVNKTIRYLVSLMESSSEAKTLGYVVGAGTEAFCPQYSRYSGMSA